MAGNNSDSAHAPESAGNRVNPAEIESIFREHNDSLIRFIMAKVGSSQEAREIAQEAYVRLLSLEQGAAIGFLRAFLFKIAANLATDRLRSRARREVAMSSDSFDHRTFDFSPERTLEGEQSIALLREAMNELPQRCREVFLLYRLQGMTCAEVAQQLGLQERMVRRYVARALEHIRARVYGDN